MREDACDAAGLASPLNQHGRNDPIGNLARDVACDPYWPTYVTTREECEEHLVDRGACDRALEALDRAWEEYGHAAAGMTGRRNRIGNGRGATGRRRARRA